jgi:hypothetical protein
MEKGGGTRSWPFATDFQQHQIHPSLHRPSRMRNQILSLRDLKIRVRQAARDAVQILYLPSTSCAKSASETGLPPRRRIFTL